MARIALFVPSFEGGGAERVMATLANLFVRRQHEVFVVTARKEQGEYNALLEADVRVVPLNTGVMWRTIVPLVRWLRRERPDALLATLGEANIVALLARGFAHKSCRVVIREASTPTLAFHRHPSLKKRITGRLIPYFYPRAEAIVAVSRGVMQDLNRLLPKARDKIHLVFNPVVSCHVLTQAQMPVVHPWFQSREKPVVLAVGRLEDPKDYPTLLKAFSYVRQAVPARLVILGEGSKRASLQQLAQSLGIGNDLDMPGFDPNPFRYMARADVFVLSSRYEGLPNVLIQAMACGCPVVSTNCPSGPEDILDGGKYGELVPVGDAKAMADAILRVLQGERKTVPPEWLAQFDEEPVADQYLRLLLT